MTDDEFYEECAAVLGTVYVCKPFPWPRHHRTRWNNRAPGSGRFPGQGLVRLFGDAVQIAIRHPIAMNAMIQGRAEALAAIRAAIPTPDKVVRIVTLAHVEDGRMLVVRKRGAPVFIQPGGKPENDDQDEIATLRRECAEELGCGVDAPSFVGMFRDEVADEPGVHVEVVLFAGSLDGEPRIQAEIEEMAWVDMDRPHVPVAPSLANIIFPVMLALTA